MRHIGIVGMLALLAACGADGEPVQPTRNATILISPDGVGVAGNVGLRKGPVSVNLGLEF